jgi:hypothetical protein
MGFRRKAERAALRKEMGEVRKKHGIKLTGKAARMKLGLISGLFCKAK